MTPEVVTGHPALTATLRAMLKPVAPSGMPLPRITSPTSAGSTWARAMACCSACAPRTIGWVALKLPRKDLARAVRAVETTTASRMKKDLAAPCALSVPAGDCVLNKCIALEMVCSEGFFG